MTNQNADGQINLTVKDGTTLTGLYAPDGSYNIVINDGSTLTGIRHPSGAFNAVVNSSGSPSSQSPNGSLFIGINIAGSGYTFSNSLKGTANLRVVANRGVIPQLTRVASASSLLCSENRMWCKTGNAACSQLRFVHSCYYLANGSGTETNVGNDHTIQVAVEWPGQSTQQVTFGGLTTPVTIPDGTAQFISDPIFPSAFGLTTFPANTVFWLRSRKTVASAGMSFPSHTSSAVSGEGSFYSTGVAAASQLMGSGVMTTPPGGNTASLEAGPSAIIGIPIGTPDIAVLLLGDSIMTGNNETAGNSGNGSNDSGWGARGLFSVNSRSVPFGKICVGGAIGVTMAAGLAKSATFFPYYTHAMCEVGTNDLAAAGWTSAQTLAGLRTLWTRMKAGGIRHIEQSLILARTTSTDVFATTANQTPVAGFNTGGTLRDPLNASIIANVGSNNLDNYLNIIPGADDATHLDVWQANGTNNFATNDGVHPQPAIHATIGAIFNTRAATYT